MILVFILTNTKTLLPIFIYLPVFDALVVSCPITVVPLVLTNSGVYEWTVVLVNDAIASFNALKGRIV